MTTDQRAGLPGRDSAASHAREVALAHSKMSSQSRIVRHYAEAAGVPGRITCHSWRHSSITADIRANNGNAEKTRIFARHADWRTTQRYVRGAQTLDQSEVYVVANYLAGGD